MIQYSEAPMIESKGCGVLDAPLSRGMTVFVKQRRATPSAVIIREGG
jgi:hypothetical protein